MTVYRFRSADVLKGIQEGGNALLKRLGDFFQTPATYTATAGASGRSSSADPGADIFFNDVYAKFMEELQNADSMTFPVLDEYVSCLSKALYSEIQPYFLVGFWNRIFQSS